MKADDRIDLLPDAPPQASCAAMCSATAMVVMLVAVETASGKMDASITRSPACRARAPAARVVSGGVNRTGLDQQNAAHSICTQTIGEHCAG